MAGGSPVGIQRPQEGKMTHLLVCAAPGGSPSLSPLTATKKDHRGGTTDPSLHKVYGEEGGPADPSTRAP